MSNMNPRWAGPALFLIVALFFTGDLLFLWLLGAWVLIGLAAR